MAYFNPLNPQLYQAIERAGLGEIRVSNEGMALQWGGISYQNGRRQRSILFWGEWYRACCLFCNDTRFRLSINHQYGQPDPLNNNWPMTHLVRCFNEDCLANAINRRRLADRIVGFRNQNARPTWEIRPGVRAESTGEPQPPGNCLFLRDLPLAHPAVQYLVVERRLSPAILYKYRLGFCIEPNRQLKVACWLQNRIVVPIYFRGEFVGWQARYVGNPPNEDIPKYVTMPGMKKSEVLYNLDRAINQPYVVVVEGVIDVWAVGDCGCSLRENTKRSTTCSARRALEREAGSAVARWRC